MERQPVTSSSIKSIGHENGVLQVEFSNGSLYEYPGVSREEYERLLAAESLGKHFAAHIRGKYSHVRVEADAKETTC